MSLPDIANVFVSQEATLAWARDKVTTHLVHISERDGAGDARPMGCAACGQLLTVADTPGSDSIQSQFLHPDGFTPVSCLIRTAQAVIEDMLQPGQSLLLPARICPGTVNRLSGAQYTVAVHDEPEQVQILSSSPTDVLSRLLTLDNDHEIEFRIVTSMQSASGHQHGERYLLHCEVDEPSLASLSLADLQLHLPELLARARWTRHWRDKELAEQGRQAALAEAAIWLDWDGGDSPLDPSLRQKALLHREAAAILENARLLKIPGWSAFESGSAEEDASQDRGQPSRMVSLAGVALEDRSGGLIPDVVVTLENGAEIILAITVPNGESPAVGTIQGAPILEMDFRLQAGFCTRHQLKEVLVQGLTGKRWLRPPQINGLQPVAEQPAEPTSRERTSEERAMYRIRPEEWARRYLNAVSDYAAVANGSGSQDADRAHEDVVRCAAGLAVHGYPGAGDPILYGQPESLLQRLVRIRNAAGQGIGDSWPVLEDIINDAAMIDLSWHSVYLMAAKSYNPPLTEDQSRRVRMWRERVRNSIGKEERYYLRDPVHDDLLGLLFPELKKGLAHPFGRRQPLAPADIDESPQDDLSNQRLTHRASQSRVLPEDYCTAKREQELVWVHPLPIRIEIAKTIRGRMILTGESGAGRIVVEELITLAEDTEPWRLATALRNQHAIGKARVLQLLYLLGLISV
jgi:hypothetical protein